MESVIFRAFCLLFMIIIGYVMKKIGILRREDGNAVARVVLNITLPCSLMVGFRDFVFDVKFLLIPLVSITVGLVMILIGHLLSRKHDRDDKIYYILALPGYNIGNFVIPFVAGVLGGSGVVAACLYDIGNAIINMGLCILVLSMVLDDGRKVSLGRALLGLFKKPPFLVYITMLVLSALNIHLPDFIFDIADSIRPANGPLAMIMIGIMMEFSVKKEHLWKVFNVMALRLAAASIAGFLFYRFAPFDHTVRMGVLVTAFAPIPTSAAAFTADYDGRTDLMGFISSVSIVVSLIIIPVLLTLF